MKGNICLHVGWSRLPENKRMLVRIAYKMYRRDKRCSISDTRYILNSMIDRLLDAYA